MAAIGGFLLMIGIIAAMVGEWGTAVILIMIAIFFLIAGGGGKKKG